MLFAIVRHEPDQELPMTETVIIPPEGRRVSGGRFIPPLLVIPFLFYNILALTAGRRRCSLSRWFRASAGRSAGAI